MYDQITNPSGCFKDIIVKHFWLKQDHIMQQINKWKTEMPKSSLDNIQKHLYDEFKKLEAPEDLKNYPNPGDKMPPLLTATAPLVQPASSTRYGLGAMPSTYHSEMLGFTPASAMVVGFTPASTMGVGFTPFSGTSTGYTPFSGTSNNYGFHPSMTFGNNSAATMAAYFPDQQTANVPSHLASLYSIATAGELSTNGLPKKPAAAAAKKK